MDLSRVSALADSQHGLVSCQQLLESGVTSTSIGRLVRTHYLIRLRHDVYAVGHRRLSESGHRLAAALSVNEGEGVIARYSAAHHHGLTARKPRHGLIEVAVPSYRGGTRIDVKVLRLGSLTEQDRVVVDGVPCTSVSRTLVDLAGVLSAHDLGKAIREADFRGMLDLPTIAGVIAGISRPRGVVQFRELLGHEPARHCDTLLERRVLQLMLDAGVPHPVLQHRFVIGRPAETIYADFFWPALQLAVEADGPHHELPSFQARDAYRDAELAAQGVLVHRVRQRAVETDPRGTATGLLAVYKSRG